MTSSRTPEHPNSTELPQASPVDKVQSSKSPHQDASTSDIQSFTLRVSRRIIVQVDEVVARHPVFRNRNTWIANAIVEQLKRENQS